VSESDVLGTLILVFAGLGFMHTCAWVAGVAAEAVRETTRFLATYRRIDRQHAWDEHTIEAIEVTR
jgi:hypothetical protein